MTLNAAKTNADVVSSQYCFLCGSYKSSELLSITMHHGRRSSSSEYHHSHLRVDTSGNANTEKASESILLKMVLHVWINVLCTETCSFYVGYLSSSVNMHHSISSSIHPWFICFLYLQLYDWFVFHCILLCQISTQCKLCTAGYI